MLGRIVTELARPTVIFFDIGGTLLKFNVEPSQLFSRILQGHGVDVEPLALYRAMREVEAAFPVPLGASARSEADYWRAFDGRILERLGRKPTREILDEIHRRFQRELILDCFPESLEVLSAIRGRGVSLGVISNASHGILGDIERNGLAPFFEHVTYSQAVGAAKPDPRIFRAALEKFRVEPERTWHVGDSVPADVEGARASGLTPILVDRARKHDGADFAVVHDLREVVRLLP